MTITVNHPVVFKLQYKFTAGACCKKSDVFETSSLEDVLSRLDVFNKSTFKYMVNPVDWTFREVEHFTQLYYRVR